MIAQTTDSAASNNFLARELERLFMLNKEDPIFWDSQSYHIRCFCHKLALSDKKGLDSLKLKSGHVKPTTQPNVRMPIPIIKDHGANQTGSDAEEGSALVESSSETDDDRRGLTRVSVPESEDDLPVGPLVPDATWGLVTSGVKKVHHTNRSLNHSRVDSRVTSF